ncbi:oligosaccharide flippase family protein [Paenibacillus thermoaerophilus]|uniref:Oligosaccharide flippase family protein n=1 Tax=Paenibacillus thermoaerophilus TaxID=1215385 RepID=A0ABW2V2U5_9BACL|nr:polysaccharide biosynthesis protein [Paenibacillus thermoaerophilus]TMV18413.1 polysaccharide biosynthesis protein [Paenibacillus thermoaerophilus]
MAKDSLVKGTLILAVAALVARALGLVQRVPLEHLLGKDGSGMFGQANNAYLALLVIATAGIPSALSKLVSERMELGRHREAQDLFRASVLFALAAGVVLTAGLYLLAPWYAEFSRVPDSAAAIRAISPTLLLFPLIAMLRGYFQGNRMMMPGGISQIVEQLIRVAAALALAGVLLGLGFSVPVAAAGAAFGSVIGGVAALAVMLYYYRKLRREQAAKSGRGTADETRLRTGEAYKLILRISVPITLFSLAVPLLYMLDSSLLGPLLAPQMGEQRAAEWLGILTGRAQPIAGLPIILAVALSQSVIPVISSAYAKGDADEVARQTSLCLRLSLLSGLPAVVALSVAAEPLTGFLYTDAEGAGMVSLLTAGTIFQILMMTTGAILMGLGRVNACVAFVGIGLAVKLAALYALTPLLGPNGIPVSTSLCFAVASVLNLWYLRRMVAYRVFGVRWVGLIATVLGMSAAGHALLQLAEEAFGGGNQYLHDGFALALSGGVMLLLYPVLLGVTGVVTKADAAAFPPRVRRLIGRFVKLPEAGKGTAT